MDFASSARALADQYDRQAAGEEEDDEIDREGEGDDDMVDRMELFMPVVQRLVGALGGFEVCSHSGELLLPGPTHGASFIYVTGCDESGHARDRNGVPSRRFGSRGHEGSKEAMAEGRHG